MRQRDNGGPNNRAGCCGRYDGGGRRPALIYGERGRPGAH